jgi:hypothetical protein
MIIGKIQDICVQEAEIGKKGRLYLVTVTVNDCEYKCKTYYKLNYSVGDFIEFELFRHNWINLNTLKFASTAAQQKVSYRNIDKILPELMHNIERLEAKYLNLERELKSIKGNHENIRDSGKSI